MAYIGKSPSQAVRNRYFFTASGGETSISSSQISGFSFSDGAYTDVYLNGVLLVAGTDYNTNTANTIAGLSALVASDIVEIVVYDTFSVFGGTFNGTINTTGLNVGSSTAVTAILDEDNMASNSATSLATQQSIKAYVDTQVATVPVGDITEVTAGTGLTGGGASGAVTLNVVGGTGITANADDIAIDATVATLTGTQTLTNKTLGATSVTADVSFGDNNKAIFGAGSDLQIYHDGSSSYVKDNGSGNLVIDTNGAGTYLMHGSEIMASFVADGAVGLRHDNSEKLATTSSGIDVTGTVTFDGGTTSADLNFGDNAKAVFGAGSDLQIYHDGSNSFVVDNGTGGLQLRGSTFVALQGTNGENGVLVTENGSAQLRFNNSPKLETTGTGIDITGQVIATKGSTGTLATFTDGVATNFTLKTDGSNVGTFGTEAGSTQLAFMVASTEAARFDGSRNFIIGKTAMGTANDGLQVKPAGELAVTRDANHSLILNRKTSDGNIALFQKDGTTVGIIGNSGSSLILSNGYGSQIKLGNNEVVPTSSGKDLGNPTDRWRDLYLSGGAYLGGTGSANHLDDYEEGTWNVTIVNGGLTPSVTSASYTKIGNRVFLSCMIVVPTNTEGQYMALGGLPFSTNGDSAGSLGYTTATTSDSIGLLVQGSTIYFYKDAQAYATSEFSNRQLRLSAQYRTT